jgi:dipeptidyl aminopeptidase/acylaminoacyl peptidase
MYYVDTNPTLKSYIPRQSLACKMLRTDRGGFRCWLEWAYRRTLPPFTFALGLLLFLPLWGIIAARLTTKLRQRVVSIECEEDDDLRMVEPHLTAQDLYKIAKVSEPRFSPDGQWLAYVRTEVDRESNSLASGNGYRSAIWLAPLAGGRCRQFTSGDQRDNAPRWSADGRWLAFVSNRGRTDRTEKAKPQLYLIPTDGGEAHQLTEMENGAGEPVWSPDGRHLVFVSRVNAEEMAAEDAEGPTEGPEERQRRIEDKEKREREKADPRIINRFAYRAETNYLDGRTGQLYILELDLETGQAMGKPRRLTHDGRNYSDPHWMPDGSALLAVVDRDPEQDDLFYHSDVIHIPLNGEKPVILTGRDTADHNPRPSPDGRWIAYNSLPVTHITTANSELKLIPVEGGKPQQTHRVLTAELDSHARDPQWMPDSKSLCFLVAERGRIDLHRLSLDGGPVETLLSADREILAYDLSPDGADGPTHVGFVASTDRAPWDLYVAALDGSHEQRLTEVNAPWLAEKTLGQVEDLWFESKDGTPVQGWIVKPPDFDPQAKYPLVLSIHGGPHVMWSRHEPTMWHEWQVLAGAGYVVLACNPRGSDGYGRDFRSALLSRWGEADLPDLQAGLEHVIAQGYIDPERLVVTGGSYGGFMTVWVIGHDDRFKAAVAQRGVYDLVSFYSTSDIPLLTEWEFSATPWEDPMLLWKYSPLAYVKDIHTPLLLIHSENDFRAPIPAAEGLFVALRRLKHHVEMVRYPRDGHELSRSGEPKHRIDRIQRILDWFDRHSGRTGEGTDST